MSHKRLPLHSVSEAQRNRVRVTTELEFANAGADMNITYSHEFASDFAIIILLGSAFIGCSLYPNQALYFGRVLIVAVT